MTSSSGQYAPPKRYVNDSGRTLGSREFWALLDLYRESGNPMRVSAGRRGRPVRSVD